MMYTTVLPLAVRHNIQRPNLGRQLCYCGYMMRIHNVIHVLVLTVLQSFLNCRYQSELTEGHSECRPV